MMAFAVSLPSSFPACRTYSETIASPRTVLMVKVISSEVNKFRVASFNWSMTTSFCRTFNTRTVNDSWIFGWLIATISWSYSSLPIACWILGSCSRLFTSTRKAVITGILLTGMSLTFRRIENRLWLYNSWKQSCNFRSDLVVIQNAMNNI